MKILRLLLIAPFFTGASLFAQYAAPAVEPTPPAPAKVTSPAPVPTDSAVAADAVLKAVHYDEMMGKALDQQKQMIRQMAMRASMPGTSAEDIAAFQQKAVDAAFVGLSAEEIHAVAVRNYAETFTTDELHAIADFYNSPAGQAYATKRLQTEQKIGAALRPRVMEAMQKIQQMTRDFAAQQQAKAQEEAAKAAAAKDQKTSSAPAAPATSATPVLTLPKP
jgi:hypothetical protein